MDSGDPRAVTDAIAFPTTLDARARGICDPGRDDHTSDASLSNPRPLTRAAATNHRDMRKAARSRPGARISERNRQIFRNPHPAVRGIYEASGAVALTGGGSPRDTDVFAQ